jgi:hypothetical protein
MSKTFKVTFIVIGAYLIITAIMNLIGLYSNHWYDFGYIIGGLTVAFNIDLWKDI